MLIYSREGVFFSQSVCDLMKHLTYMFSDDWKGMD